MWWSSIYILAQMWWERSLKNDFLYPLSKDNEKLKEYLHSYGYLTKVSGIDAGSSFEVSTLWRSNFMVWFLFKCHLEPLKWVQHLKVVALLIMDQVLSLATPI